jgi:GrpB-like predicted nucleotidyltransferase (UPF0157 family)
LRNNEAARIQYEQLKQELSTVNKGNKHKYADEKTNFVKSILDNIKNYSSIYNQDEVADMDGSLVTLP